MIVKVVRTGSRFALNYPRAQYARGGTYPIYWNVANTDKAPINCTSVDVSLSLDGGQHFNYTIANNIPNTGDALITVPVDIPTSAIGRFKMKCSDNIFYAVSYRNFFVTTDDDSSSPQYDNEDQAETSLRDISLALEATSVTTSPIVSDNNNGSGGGAFNFLIYMLLIVYTKRKYNY